MYIYKLKKSHVNTSRGVKKSSKNYLKLEKKSFKHI